jgi:hypothetical protein
MVGGVALGRDGKLDTFYTPDCLQYGYWLSVAKERKGLAGVS